MPSFTHISNGDKNSFQSTVFCNQLRQFFKWNATFFLYIVRRRIHHSMTWTVNPWIHSVYWSFLSLCKFQRQSYGKVSQYTYDQTRSRWNLLLLTFTFLSIAVKLPTQNGVHFYRRNHHTYRQPKRSKLTTWSPFISAKFWLMPD